MDRNVEIFLEFSKANKYIVSRTARGADIPEDKKQAFSDLCAEIDEIWAGLDDSGKAGLASALIGEQKVFDNKVLHYALYGKAKEKWFGDPFKQ